MLSSGIFGSGRGASGSTSKAAPASSSSAAPPFTPIIFCGPGSNLYPLCDPQATSLFPPVLGGGVSSSASGGGIKALLPVINRPALSFPLQLLFSAGLNYAVVFAARESHSAIAAALKTCSLTSPSATGKAAAQPSSNIVVKEWGTSSKSTTEPLAQAAASDLTSFYVELFPLGPSDAADSKDASRGRKGFGNADDEDSDEDEDGITFGKRTAGTSQLLLWLHEIGRLPVSPQ